MRVLFVNVPFVKVDESGQIHTGPNAGSRWPFTNAGYSSYGCFPFFMAYAVSYLRGHGVDADFYDAVAARHWDLGLVRAEIARRRPSVVFFETSTPLFRAIADTARWTKEHLGARIVFVGPHVQAYAEDILALPFADHAIMGEYERPALDIVEHAANGTAGKAKRLYEFELLEELDTLGGANLMPHRPLDLLWEYYDPSMDTPRVQLTVSTSRGCPFKCTYCQWPKVMNNGSYRFRKPETVLDEIRTVIRDHAAYVAELRRSLGGQELALYGLCNQRLAGADALLGRRDFPQAAAAFAEAQELQRALASLEAGGVRSIFFDDDTWNLGKRRVQALCAGLKDIGLPWTMMGRIDTTGSELFDLMVDSGCVGMRFGIESFSQRLLDNTKKNLDARQSYETVKQLITRHNNLEFHFTTMRNLPGETPQDWQTDQQILTDLQALGARNNNRIHWQNSSCIPFPGTELWEEMVALGKGDQLRNFDMYDGGPSATEDLASLVGWLGQDYAPKWSKYSKLGAPTNLPDREGRAR
jgi:radical SAM superfamily enzyme YgiQ (UPF0313 family)